MAKLVREKWDCNDNETIQRRAYNNGEVDEAKIYKILG